MNIHDELTRRFVYDLTKTAKGRAHLLNQIADAEDNGEAQVFDQAMSWVDDPTLKKVIDRHRTDEIRHGVLFRQCRDRTGAEAPPLPSSLKMLEVLNRKLGGFFDRPIAHNDDVVETYLVLQVLEERALTQFPLFEKAFRRMGDVETARIFREVAEDEARHLRYCKAVTKRYGRSEAAVQKRLQELRLVEAEAFIETGSANTEYCLELGLISGSGPRLFWRALNLVGGFIEMRPMTVFAASAA
jgi:rubrerythrin